MKEAGKARLKETAIGWIPEAWDCVPQSEIVTFHNGRAYKLTEWETEGTPVIRLQNLTGSGDTYYYSNLNLPANQYVNKGDLLFMWSATFGPHIWLGEKAIYHYHIWKVDCSERVDRSYMFYSLSRFTEEMKNKTNGSTMLHLTKAGMEKESIALPPISEQKKIASILTAIDDKLLSIKRQIEVVEALKKGLMQTLFNRGLGTQDKHGCWVPHVAFKDSELGAIPEDWNISSINDCLEIARGFAFKSEDYRESGHKIVRVSNISESGEIDLNKNIVFLDDAEATTYSNFLIREGDVLLVMVGATVGKLGFVKATNLPALLNQNMWALRTKNHEYINQKYCQYALVVLVGKYKQAQQGSARAFFTQSDFGNQLIAIPPMPEQLMIAKVLSSVDLKIELLHKKYKGYSTLKRGLMQKLLTGEWRVKLDSPTCTA